MIYTVKLQLEGQVWFRSPGEGAGGKADGRRIAMSRDCANCHYHIRLI